MIYDKCNTFNLKGIDMTKTPNLVNLRVTTLTNCFKYFLQEESEDEPGQTGFIILLNL